MSACGADEEPLTAQEAWEKTREEAQMQMEEERVPGMSVVVVVDGKVAFSEGFGVRTYGTQEPVDTQTLFHAFSVSKGITGLAAVLSEEVGNLSLNAPVSDYEPMLQFAGGQESLITPHMALTHTSGIPDDSPVTNSNYANCSETAAEHWQQNRGELWSEPGAVWNYSNDGFNLAGYVTGLAEGEPFTAAAKRLVMDPLGMTHTTYDVAEAIAFGNVASPHGVDGGMPRVDAPDSLGCHFAHPAQGMLINAEDFGKYMLAVLGLSPEVSGAAYETWTKRHAPTTPGEDGDYAYGLRRSTYKGLDVITHGGAWTTAKAYLFTAPEKKFAVGVLYNTGSVDRSRVALAAADAFLNLNEETESFTPDPSKWDQFTGIYDSNGFIGTTRVDYDDEQMKVYIQDDALKIEVEQVGPNQFAGTLLGNSVTATFWKDEAGNVTHLVTRAGVGIKR